MITVEIKAQVEPSVLIKEMLSKTRDLDEIKGWVMKIVNGVALANFDEMIINSILQEGYFVDEHGHHVGTVHCND